MSERNWVTQWRDEDADGVQSDRPPVRIITEAEWQAREALEQKRREVGDPREQLRHELPPVPFEASKVRVHQAGAVPSLPHPDEITEVIDPDDLEHHIRYLAGVERLPNERIQKHSDETRERNARFSAVAPDPDGFSLRFDVPFGRGRNALDTVRRQAAAKRELQQRVLESGTSAAALKLTGAGDFIGNVRNAMALGRAGITIVSGLTGPQQVPVQTGSGTATWRAENPGSALAVSDMALGSVSMAFRTIQSTAAFTRQTLFSARSAGLSLSKIVLEDLAAIIALAGDLGGLTGTGTNQPLGAFNTTSVPLVAFGANGLALAATHVPDLVLQLDQAKTLGLRRALIGSPDVKRKGANTARHGLPLWGDDDTICGLPAIASQQVPSNFTKGTSTTCSGILLGAFEHMLLGVFGSGLEIIVDPFSRKGEGVIEISALMYCDIQLARATSFLRVQDVLTT